MFFVVKNSLIIAFIGIIITTFLSLVIIFISGYFSKKIKNIIDIIVTLPLFIPPSVSGYFILSVFGVQGIIGKPFYDYFGIRFTFTVYGAIIAGIIVSLPIVYQSIRLAMSSIDKEYFEEAELLGANNYHFFMDIVFPMSKRGIIAGIVLGAGRILGEFGATLMVAGNIPNKTQTLPIAIYSAVENGEDKEAMFLVLIVLWISIVIMFVYNFLKKRGDERDV
ncbi:molybdate ABC transporter permease subunit [Fusobacterium perfoetens]|uniref:molybdate ABC transporter permease subunit n=1 Tax=Fusobacterium perfoetens TaxID=852 RepID=UPI0015A182A4|nr:molybdate ABC transporter permease subunit [Fusobacterium perfoetens]MCF2625660.1 molybdate ABC transporter permease subunit [Fusobacterium perfoetens]